MEEPGTNSDSQGRDGQPNIELKYDMVTSTIVFPDDPNDREKLTEAERTLALPILNGCTVEERVYSDGVYESTIIIKDPDNAPEYPKNMIGGSTVSKENRVKRIETKNGLSIFYNENGEKISSKQQSMADIAYYQSVMENLHENVQLSSQAFEYVLDAFEEAGYTLRANADNSQYLEMDFQRANGGKTTLFIDKERQHLDSRVNYNADGQVETISDLIFFDDGIEKDVVKGHRFVSFYNSPFSDVRMGIHKVTEFIDMEININNQ